METPESFLGIQIHAPDLEGGERTTRNFDGYAHHLGHTHIGWETHERRKSN